MSKDAAPMHSHWLISGIVIVGITGILLLIPFTMSSYVTKLLTFILMYAVLAQSWNFIGGYTGYPSFGNIAFFGIGGYAAAIAATRWQWGMPVSILLAGAAGIALALLVGLPLLRLKGAYFAVGTLIFAQALQESISINSFTGGPNGIALPVMAAGQVGINREFYFLMLGLLILVTLVSLWVRNSRLGAALLAIRSDEATAEALGINLTQHKVAAFALSAFFTAIAGGLYAYWITFIEPIGMFQISMSVSMIVMVLLGGAGTIWGPVIGAFVLQLVSELTWSNFLEYHLAVLGLIIMVVILVFPEGLWAFGSELKNNKLSLAKRLRRYSV